MRTISDRLAAALARNQTLTQAGLARATGATTASVSNWFTGKSATMKAANLRKAAAYLGCSQHWLETGDGSPDWTNTHPPSDGIQPGGVLAREVSHRPYKVTPTHIAWERLMTEPLPDEFQTVMPDNSMMPEIPRGATILCIVGPAPEPGDFVLVKDNHGQVALREYRQRPGHWEAHALNPSFLPMTSNTDSLHIIAIFDGMRGRRSRR